MQIEWDKTVSIGFNYINTVFTTKAQSMLLSDASTWSQLIISSLEIIAVIWAVFKYINRVSRKLDKLDDISARLNVIESQYRPNGGSSMKDAVNRIEKQLDKVQDRLDSHIDHNRKE
jgi:hypothetical protein